MDFSSSIDLAMAECSSIVYIIQDACTKDGVSKALQGKVFKLKNKLKLEIIFDKFEKKMFGFVTFTCWFKSLSSILYSKVC